MTDIAGARAVLDRIKETCEQHRRAADRWNGDLDDLADRLDGARRAGQDTSADAQLLEDTRRALAEWHDCIVETESDLGAFYDKLEETAKTYGSEITEGMMPDDFGSKCAGEEDRLSTMRSVAEMLVMSTSEAIRYSTSGH